MMLIPLLSVAGSFLLRLSPYLVVALILAAAGWIIFRQFAGHRGHGCCDSGTCRQTNETEFPFSGCTGCSGCQVYGCARHPERPERKSND